VPNLFKPKPRKLIKPPLGTPINPSHPISRGLVAAWMLNEGGGVGQYGLAYDSTGNNSTGTFKNTSGGTYPVWQPANFGIGVYFQATGGQQITIPANSTINPTAACTYAGWVNFVSTTSFNHWFTTAHVAESDNTFCAQVDSAAIRYDVYTSGNGFTDHTGSTTINPDTWYHIVHTYDSATGMSLGYVNGVLDSTQGPLSGTIVYAGSPTTIGAYTDGNYASNCTVDNCLIWNRALSITEIQQLYADPFCFMQPARGQVLSFGNTSALASFPGIGSAISGFSISSLSVSGSSTLVPRVATWAASGSLVAVGASLSKGKATWAASGSLVAISA
jgi:hypothetical protein